jgi:hypothetical protein
LDRFLAAGSVNRGAVVADQADVLNWPEFNDCFGIPRISWDLS